MTDVTANEVAIQEFLLRRVNRLRELEGEARLEQFRYVCEIADKVREGGGHLPVKWVDGVLHRLKHDGPTQVLRYVTRLARRYPQIPRAGDLLAEAARADGLSQLSTAGLADWVWKCGE